MTNHFDSNGWTSFNSTLRKMQQSYEMAGDQARRDMHRRLRRLSNHMVESLERIGDATLQIESVRCGMFVSTALDRSEHRFTELLKAQLAGLDLSQVWVVLWAAAKEVALYVGGGAVLGGAIGGGLGALGGGIGAVPGAAAGTALGAQLGTEVLVWMGLGELVIHIGKTIPDMAVKMIEGFALAWQAGRLPENARAQSATMMQQSVDAFAQGKMLLFIAILSAIALYLSRGQAKQTMLLQHLSNSKLGPKFSSWVGANRDKLVIHPALQPRSAAADVDAAAAAAKATPAAPASKQAGEPVNKPAPVTEKPRKEGEAAESCPVCLLVANPVNPISGSKILAGNSERDFALPAALPLVWQRIYSSAQRKAGWLGQGWSTPLSEALHISDGQVVVLDAFHREITFSLPRVGDALYSLSEKITLERTGERSFELIDEKGLRNQFAMLGRAYDTAVLVGMVDANGNKISIAWNARHMPESIEDSAGRVFVLDFIEHRGQMRLGSVSVQRDPVDYEEATNEVLVQYAYDELGNLSEVRNRMGQVVRQFAYSNHVMVEHAQPGGLVSRYEYDEYEWTGKVTRNWTNNGMSWDFRYLAGETVVTDNLGRQQHYRFDKKRRFTGMVDAIGGETTRRLDSNGNLIGIVHPGGQSTSYRYDGRSRVVRVESGGKGTGIVYDTVFDKPALITDALGATTALRYDERGNLHSVTDALGQRTTYQYDEQGLPVKVVDAAGGVKRLAFNRAAQLISYTDCSGQSSYYSYDVDGRLLRVTDANGGATSYAYDAAGRLMSAVQPDGTTERYEYDALGRLLARIDAAGNRTSYELDEDGKPRKRTDARGGVLAYRYDDVRRMAELINENGDVHRFVYDALDRLIEETGFDARLTRYRYDDGGQLVAKEEHGSGARTEYTRIDTSFVRDSAGQLVDKIISRVTGEARAEQLRLRYAYDELGRMTQAANADAQVSLQYDALGRLVAEQTDTDGGTTLLRHAYDEMGNRIQTVLPDGRVLNNLFYGSGHLHQINIDGEVVTDIERDQLHRPVSRTHGALTSQFRYDSAGRLLSQVTGQIGAGEGAGPVIARQYEYDDSGNLLAIDDKRNGRTAYSYDVIGRILSAVQPRSDERFAFDPAHNLLDDTIAGVGRVEGNRVRVFEDKRYDYDAHGNLSEKLVGSHTQMRFEWNGAHQLVKALITRDAQGDQPAVHTVKYAYDPFGRRIAKRDKDGTTRFAWDGNRLLGEAREGHSRTYIYEPDSFVPVAQFDIAAPTGGEAGARARSVLHYLHTDHLGTPREATRPDGELAWGATFKAWGAVLEETAPQTAALPDGLDQFQAIRFQGQYHDIETGLHYNRFRYYDPDVGRFVSCDPIGLQGGNNLHAYAPNPTQWVDPLGLTPCQQCGADHTGMSFEQILVAHGAEKRALIVAEIEAAVQPSIQRILALDPNARVGFRGSLVDGLKNDTKLGPQGERVAFDGHVATKNGEPYTGQQGYDVDFLVVSNALAKGFKKNVFFKDISKLDRSLKDTFRELRTTLEGKEVLSGMKSELPVFRVFTERQIANKPDAPHYFTPVE
ncbi:DUF6861 domain-containing protein [Massilia scottii]|uniref:DUF6861 domain-containing protein n=1 Tax=Massilia scottii TaxID=3057166 RepID=UPI0027969F62|nr:RHS repeat-associated core domain-containing protein [Massilia sp. CCM 9029]MDQ1829414.1 RHS repeat-associated core domain-containing protein [Massilia sp. CCM 9029]